MLKRAILCCALFVMMLRPAAAQQNTSIQMNPLYPIIGLYTLAMPSGLGLFVLFTGVNAEFALSNKYSLAFDVSGLFAGPVAMLGLAPTLVIYPYQHRMRGWFINIMPYMQYFYVPSSNIYISEDTEGDAPAPPNHFFTLGLGVGTGYKWILDNGFTISLAVNIGKTLWNRYGILVPFIPDLWMRMGGPIEYKLVSMLGYSF